MTEPLPVRTEASSSRVHCPICLAPLDWDTLPSMKKDPKTGQMTQIQISKEIGANPLMLKAELRDSYKRCPDPRKKGTHELPAEYGNHGKPIVIGLAGETNAGKSHFLASVVKLLDAVPTDLKQLGISCVPVDRQRHQRFMDSEVLPLFTSGTFLRPTGERVVEFADAFVVTVGDTSRVVAFFDIAGGDLQKTDIEKAFLDLVDGIVFVTDADALRAEDETLTGDRAFSTVMNLLADGRADEVAAAVVLMKGDLVRFEEPIDVWWRRPAPRTRAALHAESRDVFAYIDSRGGEAWLRPVGECGQTTLHVVSATSGPSTPREDGEVFQRDVVAHRVAGPLISLLAMKGVVTLPDAVDGVVGVRRTGR